MQTPTSKDRKGTLAFDLMDAMQSPVITFAPEWYPSVPERIKDLIIPSRLAALLKGDQMATLPEVVAYLATRSNVAPMDSDWTEIFAHTVCTVCERYFKESHWNTLDAKREQSRHERELLISLRQRIYEKRRQNLKLKMKHGKTY